jgi:hypothetical protein
MSEMDDGLHGSETLVTVGGGGLMVIELVPHTFV